MVSPVCVECAAKVLKNDEIAGCSGGCDRNYCVKCSKLTRSDFKVLNDNINKRYFCNSCSIRNANTRMVEIKAMIENTAQQNVKKERKKTNRGTHAGLTNTKH